MAKLPLGSGRRTIPKFPKIRKRVAVGIRRCRSVKANCEWCLTGAWCRLENWNGRNIALIADLINGSVCLRGVIELPVGAYLKANRIATNNLLLTCWCECNN